LAKKGDFASQAAQVGRDGGQAVGENPAADDLRSLRTVSPGVEEVSADAELCGEFGKWGQCSQINKMLVCFEMIDHFYAWHDNLDLNTRTLITM
jgi:hypothetical protein